VTYRERLLPSPWIYLAAGFLIPASLLVFAPISWVAGVVCALVLFGGSCLALVATSPVVEIADGEFRAGRARIPLSLTADPEGFRGAEATAKRGPELDARAYLCLRGWIDPIVRVHITDPADPAPYWVVSTRHPEDLVAALNTARAGASPAG
jgi:hypothetical protein